jgi:hypothetical protein
MLDPANRCAAMKTDQDLELVGALEVWFRALHPAYFAVPAALKGAAARPGDLDRRTEAGSRVHCAPDEHVHKAKR